MRPAWSTKRAPFWTAPLVALAVLLGIAAFGWANFWARCCFLEPLSCFEHDATHTNWVQPCYNYVMRRVGEVSPP